jgi:hypothetical protein
MAVTNIVYAMIAFAITVAFLIWFAVENSRTERNNLNWGLSMAMMIASAVAVVFFGYNGMKNMRNSAMPANVAPAVANMPSNMAGSANAQPATI